MQPSRGAATSLCRDRNPQLPTAAAPCSLPIRVSAGTWAGAGPPVPAAARLLSPTCGVTGPVTDPQHPGAFGTFPHQQRGRELLERLLRPWGAPADPGAAPPDSRGLPAHDRCHRPGGCGTPGWDPCVGPHCQGPLWDPHCGTLCSPSQSPPADQQTSDIRENTFDFIFLPFLEEAFI